MSTPVLGRNARLIKENTPIGYCKNISVKASAEIIKEYSMDALNPAVSGSGKQTFTWSAERLFTDKTYMDLLQKGTSFSLIFGPEGTPITGTKYETWTSCVILSCERTAGETGAVLEKISGEASGITFPPA
jgi:hypothetical protein